MPITDFRNELKKSLHTAADTVRDKVKDINTTEIKENLQNAAETVKDKFTETGGKATKQMKDFFQKKDYTVKTPEQDHFALSVRNALKIIYYLMAADGEIFHGEEEKFDAIGKELDPNFEQVKADIINECKISLELTASKEPYRAALHAGIDSAIIHSHGTDEAIITPKLLVWDLLTVAYSDERYDQAEQDLINYVVKKCNVDQAIYLEMQSSILTVLDLEKELVWVKTTNRPYLAIEVHVNEINERKKTIMDSVMALISL